MLKFSVIVRTLSILTLVFLRYFKAICNETEYILNKKIYQITIEKGDIRNVFMIKSIFL